MSWTDIGQAEEIRETDKAVEIRFGDGTGRGRDVWVPKSCYRKVERGAYIIQEVKTWLICENQLWNILNSRSVGC